MSTFVHKPRPRIKRKFKAIKPCYKYEMLMLPFLDYIPNSKNAAMKAAIEEIRQTLKESGTRYKITHNKSKSNFNRTRIQLDDLSMLVYIKMIYSELFYKIYEL